MQATGLLYCIKGASFVYELSMQHGEHLRILKYKMPGILITTLEKHLK